MAEIPPVIQASLRFQAQLKARDNAAMKRIIRAYQQSYAALKDKIDLLLLETAGQELTQGQLVRLTRYKELMSQVDEELRALQVLTRNEVRGGATAAVAQGARDAAQLMSYAATGGPGLAAGFNRLPTATITQLLGFLSPDGPLYERLSKYAEVNGKNVADALIQGITLGQNPRVIAADITRNYGMALTDSLRMTRTVNLYSYREANRASYVANADILDGWYWYAALDDRTCASCWAMHGTGPYPLDEPLNDHHNGRCAMVPAVTGFDNPIEQTGEQLFKEQSESRQAAIMGKEKYAAYQGGAFEFRDLTTTRINDIYGAMRTETPLWELLGAEPPTRMNDR